MGTRPLRRVGLDPSMRQSPSFALIFDMDGVLVDSEPLTIRAYVQAASEFGVGLDPQEYVQRVVIEGWLIRSLFEARGGDPAEWKALFRRKTEIYSGLVESELHTMPGAVELLTELKSHGVPCAVATSASRVTMDLVLEARGLARYFDAAVTLDDVEKQKPDPEAFLKAAELLGMPPERCIVIEDAPKGIAAARAAGMRSVIVPNALFPSADFTAADLVVESLQQLTAERLAALIGERV